MKNAFSSTDLIFANELQIFVKTIRNIYNRRHIFRKACLQTRDHISTKIPPQATCGSILLTRYKSLHHREEITIGIRTNSSQLSRNKWMTEFESQIEKRKSERGEKVHQHFPRSQATSTLIQQARTNFQQATTDH